MAAACLQDCKYNKKNGVPDGFCYFFATDEEKNTCGPTRNNRRGNGVTGGAEQAPGAYLLNKDKKQGRMGICTK